MEATADLPPFMELQLERPKAKKKTKSKPKVERVVSDTREEASQRVGESPRDQPAQPTAAIDAPKQVTEVEAVGVDDASLVQLLEQAREEVDDVRLSELTHIVGDRDTQDEVHYPSAPTLDELDDAFLTDFTGDPAQQYPELYSTVVFEREHLYPVAADDQYHAVLSDVVEPSAPPLDMSVTDTLPCEPITSVPLSELHAHYDLTQRSSWLRTRMEEIATGHADLEMTPFFALVLQYRTATEALQTARLRAQAVIVESRNLAGRAWRVVRETKVEKGLCKDGRECSIKYQNTRAELDEDVVAKLEATLADLREVAYGEVAKQTFETKLAKLRIQEEINQTLVSYAELQKYQAQSQKSDTAAEQASRSNAPAVALMESSGVGAILPMLAVLFHFARTPDHNQVSLLPKMSLPSTGTSASSLPSSPFMRDIRGWTCHLVNATLRLNQGATSQYLLWEVLRTPGIGDWGAWFLQFSPPSILSDGWIDNYLTSLWCMMKDALNSKEVESAERQQEPVDDDELEWVVIQDTELSEIRRPQGGVL
ncbi:hypothetical protein M427DRAFT_34669 [Gonapodya prolifera JEL478]|uniref:Uncharacterized protein n=1 Tax=Gonapodya prolifera (strain JEL478) TaxID=1344416 RepID=A0A139A7A7_GONPJ|nr:hypothetical protein M427DRAFT_34669 [Gonapodya prolifera JEL478]|eukprot:KXS12671.1 hypothetical protein M427DRAFT_34669 [Gonapodya prolifera JEL478]